MPLFCATREKTTNRLEIRSSLEITTASTWVGPCWLSHAPVFPHWGFTLSMSPPTWHLPLKNFTQQLSVNPDLGRWQIGGSQTISEGWRLIFQLESKLNIKTKTPLHYLSLHLGTKNRFTVLLFKAPERSSMPHLGLSKRLQFPTVLNTRTGRGRCRPRAGWTACSLSVSCALRATRGTGPTGKDICKPEAAPGRRIQELPAC